MGRVATAPVAVPTAPAVRAQVSRDEWIMRGAMTVIGLGLVVTLALPLGVMLAKSFQNAAGEMIGLANYGQYFATPALARSTARWIVRSARSRVRPSFASLPAGET